MRKKIKEILKAIAFKMPFKFLYKKITVSQIYINDSLRTSKYSLPNFVSFLDPKQAKKAFCYANLYDDNGTLIFSKKIPMGTFETLEVDFNTLCDPKSLPQQGIVTLRLVPQHFIFNSNAILGHITSHFFSLFSSRDGGVCGLIHPQSSFEPGIQPDLKWISNLSIPTEGVACLEVFQMNPNRDEVESQLLLYDENRKVVFSEAKKINRYGSRYLKINKHDFHSARHVKLGMLGATGENCKPLIFITTDKGIMSAVHS